MLNAWLALRGLNWKLIGFSALALAFLSLVAALKIERIQNGKLQAQIEKCAAARVADEIAYRAAQAEAAKLNLEDIRRREQKQEQANAEVTADLNARLERLRRELRQGADQGSPGGPGSPQAPGQPGTVAATRLCYAPEVILHAAENEERHDQLITLIERLIAEQK